MNGLEPVRSKDDGLWRLRFLRPSGGYVRDESGAPVTFPSKAAALRGRRALGLTDVVTTRQDFFAGRVDRSRRRR